MSVQPGNVYEFDGCTWTILKFIDGQHAFEHEQADNPEVNVRVLVEKDGSAPMVIDTFHEGFEDRVVADLAAR